MDVCNGEPVCHMHLPAGDKDLALFAAEVEAIFSRASADTSGKTLLDFTGFHFPGRFMPKDIETLRSNYSLFPGRPVFKGATFHGPIDWYGAHFPGGANFSGAKFIRHVDVRDGMFVDRVDFTEAVFREGATFASRVFCRAAYFRDCVFGGPADFGTAVFTSTADFEGSHFAASVRFVSTVFSETARYLSVGTGDPIEDDAPAVCSLRRVEFEQARLVVFSRVNRGDVRPASRRSAEKGDFPGVRIYLTDCDIRGVEFNDVNWLTFSNRLMLADEAEVRGRSGRLYNLARQALNVAVDSSPGTRERGHEAVAIAYRRLMASFDASAQSELAEDCYVGAMEMVRLDRARPGFQRFVYNVYRLLSNYGSSYRRAFAVLLLLTVLFAAAYATPAAGLTRVGGGGAAPVSRVGAALLHSVEIATFQRDSVHVTSTPVGHLLEVLQSVVMPTQLALLLLALRRRLKR